MKNKKYISLAVLGSLALVAPVFVQASVGSSIKTEIRGKIGDMMGRGGMMNLRGGVVGTVTSINGTTLTVTSVNKVGWGMMDRFDNDNDGDDKSSVTPVPRTTPTPVTYTIDASKASVIKAGVASTVSGIAVGDMVMVQGTVVGTNIVATVIRDGLGKGPKVSPTPVIVGNGQPVIAGTISAVNGPTLTVTNQSNITYTVNAATAKVASKGVLSTLSAVAVGDNVVIQGTINGTAVTAYSVTDQGPTPVAKVDRDNKDEGRGNIFGGIGQFFKHIFGF